MGDPTPPATPPATAPSRRLVAVGALGGIAALLTGCGIRLEDDAPRVPLVPTRRPIPGEAALVGLLGALQLAAVDPALAGATPSPATLHRRQADVLRDALLQRGVPSAALAAPTPAPTGTPAPASPTPATTASPSPRATPSVPVGRTVAAVEGSVLAAADGCSEAEAALRPPVVALLAQAHAAIELTTGRRAAPGATATAWSSPDLLAPLIDAARRATYLLEVAAARTGGRAQRLAREEIALLEALTAEVVGAAGEAAPVPELGYALPGPVTTAAEAAALTIGARATLLGSWGAQLQALTAGDARAAFADVPRWLGGIAAVAHRGGTPLTAFPGLA